PRGAPLPVPCQIAPSPAYAVETTSIKIPTAVINSRVIMESPPANLEAIIPGFACHQPLPFEGNKRDPPPIVVDASKNRICVGVRASNPPFQSHVYNKRECFPFTDFDLMIECSGR